MNVINSAQSIPGFYANRSVFITGGTGFMGKVLIEKLLRSCPDIHEIFILLRPKRELSIQDRLKNALNLPVSPKQRSAYTRKRNETYKHKT